MNEYISREAMLRNLTADLEHHSDEGDPRTNLIMQRFIEYVENFPSTDVQPVDRWISVNNRPEKDGKYLCYLESGNVCEAYYDSMIASEGEFPFGEWVGRFDSDTLGFIDTDWQPYDAITHWQPLPEPPKDGDTNG